MDLALAITALVLFGASATGLSEHAMGGETWTSHWKVIHDVAKALILPLIAWGFLRCQQQTRMDPGIRNRVLAAMTLCWIGDVALTRSGDAAFLTGLVSFLSGHVLYIFAFRRLLSLGAPRSDRWTQRAALALLSLVLTPVVVQLWRLAGPLAPAVAVYACVIATMAFYSWRLAKGSGVIMLRAGAILFMVSDLILAFAKFGTTAIPLGHFWVMSTYILAQVALSKGFAAATQARAQASASTGSRWR